MILSSFRMAIKSVLSNKMRTFLTMLGIIIGVVALIVLVSLVNGATGSITDSIHALGNDVLRVSITDDYNRSYKLNELKELTELEHVKEVAPVSQTTQSVTASYSEESATIIGTSSALSEIQGLSIISGRFLMSPDLDNHSNLAVVNKDLATALYGRNNCVGETFSMNGREFLVVGIYQEKNSSSNSSSEDYKAYIPYTSYVRIVDGESLNISSFYVSSEEGEIELAEEELEQTLLNRFYSDEDAFHISSSSVIAETMSSISTTLSLLLGGIAGISLLVGGIGIMNIMLVSVTERTKEIGIRKAIGAGRTTILIQFLIEALTVSLIGCIIGIILSGIIIQIVNIFGNVSYSMHLGVAVISVVFSLGIGLIFGLYPANKASKMKPIDALRFS